MASAGATARRVDAETVTRPPVDEASIETMMRELIHQKTNNGVVEATTATDAATVQSAPRRDFDMAAELLDRAEKAFDVLINRCQTLEYKLEEVGEHAAAHAAEQEQTIEQWKKIATNLKAQLETTEQAMASLRKRCDTVQARAVKAEEMAKAMEAASIEAASHAALAENLSTKLHDKVVTAFGIGSRAHPVLEAVATRHAAE